MLTKPAIFQKNILSWFDQHGRKTLPWQIDKTPYRVWVSEIMLQQTQVSTVIPYYERFMARFPTLDTLAEASADEVLHYWTGLGYYSRARNLHRSAKIILETYQNHFPSTLGELQNLPGIGRSTAGAIVAIAFQQHAPILDGNVKRVLTRLLGITDWPGEKKVTEQLWEISTSLTPQKRVADYTQAIMDIGATLCLRGKPQCEKCPVKKFCIAREKNIAETIPRAKPKKTLPVRQSTFLILQNHHYVLLEKRPNLGIWGGLWSLPEIKGAPNRIAIKKFCATRFHLIAEQIKIGETFRHTFSHFHLEIVPVFIKVRKNLRKVLEAEQQIWYNVLQPERLGLPAPIKVLLENGELK